MPVTDLTDRGRPDALVALPGTGSDADFVRRAFGPAATDLGIELIAAQPADGDLVEGYRAQLDEAARQHAHLLVGGVSLGAAISLDWALRDARAAGCCVGVWAALPAWSGNPCPPAGNPVPAALAALATADAVAREGLEPVITAMAASSPGWLAAELTRSWRALHPGLITQLRSAAHYVAPTTAQIAALPVPLALIAAADDPLHPVEVAREWAQAAPVAGLVEVGLDDWGAEPSLLGHTCARSWRRLSAGGAATNGRVSG
ncbi:MAG: alpha/beta hydrolase [Gordonia sp. (in: high G+C Gram-positive bacteria)]